MFVTVSLCPRVQDSPFAPLPLGVFALISHLPCRLRGEFGEDGVDGFRADLFSGEFEDLLDGDALEGGWAAVQEGGELAEGAGAEVTGAGEGLVVGGRSSEDPRDY